MPRYLDLSTHDRIGTVVDPMSLRWFEPFANSSVVVAGGTLDRQAVVIAATDASRAAGSIGSDDALALATAVAAAVASNATFVLLLDSAGAKLTDGVGVLGAFRRLLQVMLAAVTGGMPFIALLGRFCFGGASVLACHAHRRLYLAGGQFGLSGPKAVLAMNPRTVPAAVLGLYANARRVEADRSGELVADDTEAVRSALARHLVEAPTAPVAAIFEDPANDRSRQQPRISRSHQVPPLQGDLRVDEHVVEGTAAIDAKLHRVAGLIDGAPVNASACRRLIRVLAAIMREPEAMPVIVLLDTPGQATAPMDEAEPMSMLLARLATEVFHLRSLGRRVDLWITGQAGGAVYVALAGAADAVIAWPGASIGTLPRIAIDSVLGGRLPAGPHDLIAAGVIDRRA